MMFKRVALAAAALTATLASSTPVSASAQCVSSFNDGIQIPRLEANVAQRQFSLMIQKDGYKFVSRPGLSPTAGGPLGVPTMEADYVKLMVDHLTWVKPLVTNATMALAASSVYLPKGITKLEDYYTLYKLAGWEVPLGSRIDWTDDKVFAKERLTHVIGLKKFDDSWKELPFKHKDMKNLLDKGMQLKEAVLKGRIFVLDWSHLKTMTQSGLAAGTFSGSPTAWFYLNEAGDLIPIAIKPQANNDFVVFPDDGYDWLLAKIIVNQADLYENQANHFLSPHLFLEPLMTGALRNFAPNHPVQIYLNKFLDAIFGNSLAGWRVVFNEGGPWDGISSIQSNVTVEYFKAQYPSYSFFEDAPARQIAQRKLEGLMPKYTYLSDALELYTSMIKHIKSLLKQYYPNGNDDIVGDSELQGWANEVSGLGMVRGFPKTITNIDQLAEILGHVAYLTGIKHHAINTYILWDSMGALPGHTAKLYRAIPTERGVVNAANIVEWLPQVPAALSHMQTVRAFARPMKPGQSLVEALDHFGAGNPKIACVVEAWKQDMERISNRIQEREKNETFPYTHLDPKNLPSYVFI
jgi:hypothetical protein